MYNEKQIEAQMRLERQKEKQRIKEMIKKEELSLKYLNQSNTVLTNALYHLIFKQICLTILIKLYIAIFCNYIQFF